MSDSRENKRNSKKIAPGIAATVNRLETSRAVLNALKNVGSGSVESLSFLKDATGSATGILGAIQAIEDGEIDENFVALCLDSCGLVYIVINSCQDESEIDTEVFDQMKVESGELTRILREILDFVEKKAHRNLYKRIWKHGADEQKIVSYRDQLKKLLEKFRASNDSSIHDVLEEIIDEKLRRHQNERISRSPIPQSISAEVVPTIESMPPPPPPKAGPSPSKMSNEEPLRPPPAIIISTLSNDESTAVIMPSDLHARPQDVKDPQRAVGENEGKERQKTEAEAKKKKRNEEERLRKRAEKERWRRSEQSFIQIPEATTDAKAQQPPAVPEKAIPPSIPKPVVINIESDSEPEPDTSSNLASRRRAEKAPSHLDDERVAAALHAKMQRELESEDEKAAILEAAKLQREWEAEERKNSRTARPKRKKTTRSPTMRSRSPESSSAEVTPTGLSEEAVEGLRREARRGTSDNSSRYHSQSPKPDTAINPPYPPDMTASPFRNDVPYNAYPQLPNPYDPNYYPGPPMHPPSMAMHNISGSAISLGGGPVSNINSGNTHSTTIINSMNDNSVRYYVDDDDSE